MIQRTLCIAFGGRQVVVRSGVPEILAGLERGFREMLGQGPARTVAEIQVDRDSSQYRMLGGRKGRVATTCPDEMLACVAYEAVLSLVRAHPELWWIHAAVAAYRGRAVVLAGRSGRGKSTLIARLCAGGWAFLSDDLIPLDPQSDRVMPFPQMPRMREDPGRDVAPDRLGELPKTDVDVRPEAVCREAVPVGALVFPAYDRRGPTTLTPCSPATAVVKLLENCQNLVGHHGETVRYFCDLVKHRPVFCLSFNNARRAAELIAGAVENWHPFSGAGSGCPVQEHNSPQGVRVPV